MLFSNIHQRLCWQAEDVSVGMWVHGLNLKVQAEQRFGIDAFSGCSSTIKSKVLGPQMYSQANLDTAQMRKYHDAPC